MRNELLAAPVDMATALFSPSRPFSRKVQKWIYMHSGNCQKVIIHFASPLKRTKLYKVLLQTGPVHCFSTGSSKLQNNKLSFDKSDPICSQRSHTSHDHPITLTKDHMNDLEDQLQELFNEVKSLLVEGNKASAIDLLQANFMAVKDQIDAGLRGIEQAATLDVIALGFMGVGDFKSVDSLLEMMQEIVSCLHNDDPLLDSVLMHMGSMYTTLGKLENALLVYRRGLEILENIFGNTSPFLITPLMGMAKVFGLTGRATKAKEMYLRAISILETNRGVQCEDLVIPLFGLGNLFIEEDQAAEAESSFKRILSIYEKLYGENDGRVGTAMCSLAHALCAKGAVNEAISLYRKGLQIIKDSKFMAIDDVVLEKMRTDLAELLHVAGREQEGRKLLEECLLISEMYKGNEHPSSVTHLLNLASSYSRSKDYIEAERLLRTSLQIMSKTTGPDDHSVTVPMLHLAVTLYDLHRDEEAESLAMEVVRIREKASGEQSLAVGEALDCLVSIQNRLGRDDDKLLTLLKRILGIQERMLGSESEETVTTLKKIVFLLDKMGRKDEKMPLQRRLSMLRTKYKQKVPI
ncbi:uncharacterized protein [Aristolochia californica]|uniref:uncharacterized protein isoform X2 n=1 Tax=Aristolochia californica TaxID=171875 RepID=UPI0035E1832A